MTVEIPPVSREILKMALSNHSTHLWAFRREQMSKKEFEVYFLTEGFQ